MDWQERLRRLDGRLAAEEISMAEYRKLRDEILAEASGGTPRSAARPVGELAWMAANPGAEPSPVQIPVSAAREAPSGEMTQTVATDTSGDDTQVVHATVAAGQDEQSRTESITPPRPATRDRTPVSAAEPPPPIPGPPGLAPEAARWSPGAAPSWSGPALSEAVFATAGTSRKRKTLAVALAVVVALAIAAAAVWWFVLRNEEPTAAPAADGGTVSSMPDAAVEVIGKLAPLPGTAVGKPALLPSSVGAQLGLYPPDLVATVDQAGGVGLVNAASVHDAENYTINALDSPDPAAALAAVIEHGKKTGWTQAAGGGLPASVTVLEAGPPGQRLYRAVYRADRWTVIVSGAAATSDQDFRAAFDETVNGVLTSLPPS
jgi:hypothetical protein